MSVRRALVATVLAPLLGLALGGCQEAEPSPKMPATSAASPTPTETATTEQESAEDFIRRWVAASDEMQVTGDATDYEAMSVRCIPCRDFTDSVREVHDSGGRIAFDGSAVTELKRVGMRPPTYDVNLRVAPTVVFDAEGGEQARYPAGVAMYRVTLTKRPRGWNVSHFGRR